MRPFLFAGAVALSLTAACASGGGDDDDRAPGIAAQGTGSTRTYPATGFTAVELRDSDDVDIRVGPGFSVRADGDAALLDHLKISRVGDTLRIGRLRRTGFGWGEGHARISITMPTLSAASVAGSGNLTADRAQGPAFRGAVAGSGRLRVDGLSVDWAEISVAGSGDARLAGTARQLSIDVAGSGDIDGSGLRASRADVSVAGSGNVRATVDGPAKVSIMGSGDVDLGGKAQCQVSKLGSGSVRCGG